MSDEQRLARGSRAREVLENEEFIAAFEAIEEELTQAWKTSPQRDHTGREHIFLSLTVLHKVRAALVNTMASGTLAADELKYQKTMAERAKAYLGLN